MMKSSIWAISLGVAVVAALMGTTVYFMLRSMQAAQADRPPPSLKTIADFRAWRPTFTNAHRVAYGRITNYYVDNDNARYDSRGPRTYIFDSAGRYLETSALTADLRSLRFVASEGVSVARVDVQDIPIPE